MLKNSLILGSLLTLIVSCSDGNKSVPAPKSEKRISSIQALKQNTPANRPANAPANVEVAAPTCEEIWSGFIAANPIGAETEYTSTTVTSYTGSEGLPEPSTVVETYLEKVTKSDDSAIAIEYTYNTDTLPAPQVEAQELSKVDFLASCNAPIPNPPAEEAPAAEPTEAQPEVQIIEEGTEKLTVAAGEFDTDWVKATVTQSGDFVYSANVQEWYLTGTEFLIKSITDADSAYGEVVINSKTTVELTKNTRPLTL